MMRIFIIQHTYIILKCYCVGGIILDMGLVLTTFVCRLLFILLDTADLIPSSSHDLCKLRFRHTTHNGIVNRVKSCWSLNSTQFNLTLIFENSALGNQIERGSFVKKLNHVRVVHQFFWIWFEDCLTTTTTKY